MTPIQRSISLTLWIPLLIGAVFLSLIVATMFTHWRSLESTYIENARQYINADLSALARAMRRDFYSQDLEGARSALNSRSLNVEYRLLVLLDEDATVLFSIDEGLEGTSALGLPHFEAVNFQAVAAEQPSISVLDADAGILTYYVPINLDRMPLDLLPLRTGVLYLEYDLGFGLEELWGSVLGNSALLLVLCVLATLGILYFSGIFIIRPLHSLVASTRDMEQGKLGTRSSIVGKGELAELGQAFNSMSRHLLEDREAIERSETLLKRSQQLAQIGYWQVMRDSSLVELSAEMQKLFSLPAHMTLAEFLACFHPDDRPEIAEAVNKCLEEGIPFSVRKRLQVPGQKECWVLNMGESFYDSSRELSGVIGIVQDITEARRNESNQQKMDKLNSLGILAGGIAHDFNNTLTMLFGNIALAKNFVQEGSEAERFLSKAEEAFSRTSRLTRQLLTFAKGGDPLRKILDPAKVGKDIIQFDLTGSKVSLDFSAPAELWSVAADQSQLEQVFTNLAINAVQAMPRGGCLKVAFANVTVANNQVQGLGAGNYVRVKVEDEGGGIPHDRLLQIFDPYFSTKPEGSGLGLTTVYSIIQKHNGIIETDSLIGKGTRFTFYLPATGTVAMEAAAKEDVKELAKRGAARILVMDDEQMILDLFKTVLEFGGYEVDLSLDGNQALDMYKRAFKAGRAYDCAIFDLTIPGKKGGRETVTEVLKLNSAARVIVASGYSEDDVLARFESFGFSAALCKPFKPPALLAVVGDVLAGTGRGK